MPSLAVFAQLLARPAPTSSPQRKFYFTLADYNATVLRLVTLPNLLLTWRLNIPQPSAVEGTGNPQASATGEQDDNDEQELDVDPALLDAFQDDLTRRGIIIDFVAGAWSPQFVDLALRSRAPSTENDRPCRTLLLASETIYSPASLTAFSETLLELLRRSAPASMIPKDAFSSSPSPKSKVLIAAKKVYFGVGGGIDEFLHVLHQQRLQENEAVHVKQRVEVKTKGVGRVILQVEIQDSAESKETM